MLKQLIIWLGLMTLPIACPVLPALSDPVKSSVVESQSSVRLTVKAIPTKQHPRITKADLDAIQATIGRRLDSLGLSSPKIKSVGTDRIEIELSSSKDALPPNKIVPVLVRTGTLELCEQKIGGAARLPAKIAALKELQIKQITLEKSPNARAIAANRREIDRQQLAIKNLFHSATITGKQLINANAQPIVEPSSILTNDKSTPMPNRGWDVAVRFDRSGSETFRKLTQKVAGTGRAIGIFVDNELISSPVVSFEFAKTGITGGTAVITGAFTAATANDLAIQLRSGALPVPIEIVEIQTLRRK